MVEEAWALLDIEPTNDTLSVKRAYAVLLKKLDVDSEKPKFLKLRRAFDRAIAACEGEIEDHFEPLQPLQEEPAAKPQIEPGRATSEPEYATPHADEAKRRILAAVSQKPTPTDEVMRQLLASFFEDPDTTNLSRADNVEDWLVCTIVDHFPQSDALIEPAIAFCGWDDRHYNFNRYSDLATIFQRRRDLRFRTVLQNPSHKWHRAFQLLCSPPGSDVPVNDKIAIRGLLDIILVGNSTLQIDINKDNLVAWLDDFEKKRREFEDSTRIWKSDSRFEQQDFYEKHPNKARFIFFIIILSLFIFLLK